jgi:hypothetical protein
MSKIPNKDANIANLQEKAARRKQFQDLKPIWNDMQRLRQTEIPDLKTKLAALEKDREASASTLGDLELELASLKAESEQIGNL